MLICLWSVKGGVGTTVVTAGLGRQLAHHLDAASADGVLVVDLAGDLPAALGISDPSGSGVGEWLAATDDVPADALARLETRVDDRLSILHRGDLVDAPADRAAVLAGMLASSARTILVDCGRVDGASPAVAPLLAVADRSILVTRPCYLALRRVGRAPAAPTGVALVTEPGRALTRHDIEAVVGAPVVVEVPWDPGVARAVDAGLLSTRLPKGFARAARSLHR